MATKTPKHKRADDWYQIAEEFLVTQEAKPDLTVKEFCNMREDLKYNTARVKLTPKIKELAAKREEQRLADQREREAKSLRNTASNAHKNKIAQAREDAEGKRATQNSVNSTSHGIYGKYFNPEILERAAQGELDDDLLLYRAKAIGALDFIEQLQLDLDIAIKAKDEKAIESIEKRLASTDKALAWCITRVESIAMSIKKIELTTVLITKERANVIKTKAQTRMTLHQSNKHKAETKLAKAKAYDLEHGNKGDTAADIVKEIQTRRDLLPSFAKKEG